LAALLLQAKDPVAQRRVFSRKALVGIWLQADSVLAQLTPERTTSRRWTAIDGAPVIKQSGVKLEGFADPGRWGIEVGFQTAVASVHVARAVHLFAQRQQTVLVILLAGESQAAHQRAAGVG